MKNIILISSLSSLFLFNAANANTPPSAINQQMVQQYLINQMLLEQASKMNINKNIDTSNIEVKTENFISVPSYYVDENSLIENRNHWSRYCIEGIQYLSSNRGNSHTFTTLVDKDSKPLQCIAVPKNDK